MNEIMTKNYRSKRNVSLRQDVILLLYYATLCQFEILRHNTILWDKVLVKPDSFSATQEISPYFMDTKSSQP